jgi:hypothetical protein
LGGNAFQSESDAIFARLERLKANAEFRQQLQALARDAANSPVTKAEFSSFLATLSPRGRRSDKVPTPEEHFSDAVSFAVCWAVTPNRVTRKLLERNWAEGTGKMWKQLREFPERIESWARELDPVISSTFGAVLGSFRAEAAVRRVMRLPDTLRDCARGLRAYIDKIPRETRRVLPLSRRGYHSEGIREVSKTVKQFTGKYRDPQVAKPLQAAASALDCDWQFDATTVAQARHQRRRKQPAETQNPE